MKCIKTTEAVGHVLCHDITRIVKDVVKEPFIVINADDYYGKEAFVKVHDYLVEEHPASDRMEFCMAGFHLGNTLSENGGVARGVCMKMKQLRFSVTYVSMTICIRPM